MKVKSVSSLLFFVEDLAVTKQFYESLGFDFKKVTERNITGYINWFSIDFVLISAEDKSEFQTDAQASEKGKGIFIYLSVDDVDATYSEILEKGYNPSSEPRDWPWGNREFVLKDPDGYKLVFFKKR